MQKEIISIVPSERIDYCYECKKEHGYNCPKAILGIITSKDGNPKDNIGSKKVGLNFVSSFVMMEMALGMTEGACKYGAHNYRVAGVRASVYYSAAMRHLMAWHEGEDIDPDSGLSHITKALSCLSVLRDSMHYENWVDDRPPKLKDGWIAELNKKTEEIINKYPNPVPPFTQIKTASN